MEKTARYDRMIPVRQRRARSGMDQGAAALCLRGKTGVASIDMTKLKKQETHGVDFYASLPSDAATGG
jgi:hypothetical protein